ncbi:glycosyltransferase [Xanthomonas arboricola]|uniref:glycosyltransferase n=1 Tax=Xanthomonas arboricola TaxID=56448 RepID=UPI001F4977B7|nr:glycosyltransferase [Xanthomonas arboricola]
MSGVLIHYRSLSMKNSMKSPVSFGSVAVLATVIAFTGCSKAPEAEQPVKAEPQQAAQTTEAGGMSTPLTQEQVGARYAIASEPVLANNGELVRVAVSVTNSGKVAINSKGTLPVNLAISLVDDSGNVSNRDFLRAPLPAEGIPAGGSAEVIADVPSQAVIGKTLRFGLVQESVAWYSDFKVDSLDYGPLTSCQDQGKETVCGAGGKPLATR